MSADDELTLTILFKSESDLAKVAAYWAKPHGDPLDLQKRGWPPPSAWKKPKVVVDGKLKVALTP